MIETFTPTFGDLPNLNLDTSPPNWGSDAFQICDREGQSLTGGATIRFRVTCYGVQGSIRLRAFASEHAAKDWVRKNVKEFTKLVVEKGDGDMWALWRHLLTVEIHIAANSDRAVRRRRRNALTLRAFTSNGGSRGNRTAQWPPML